MPKLSDERLHAVAAHWVLLDESGEVSIAHAKFAVLELLGHIDALTAELAAARKDVGQAQRYGYVTDAEAEEAAAIDAQKEADNGS